MAAWIHLGKLPDDRVPEPHMLLEIPRFDRVGSDEHGLAEYVGKDADGHEVYVFGRGAAGVIAQRALLSGVRLGGGGAEEVLFVDTLVCVNLPMRIGGLLSRALGFVTLGRPLVLWGTRRAYRKLAILVEETKKRLRPAPAPASPVDPKGVAPTRAEGN